MDRNGGPGRTERTRGGEERQRTTGRRRTLRRRAESGSHSAGSSRVPGRVRVAALVGALLAATGSLFLSGCEDRPGPAGGTAASDDAPAEVPGDDARSRGTRQFRGGPAHPGVYAGPGPSTFGGLAWRAQTGGTVVSSPAVTEEAVYVGSGDGRLYALARATGDSLWTYDVGSPVSSSPAVGRGSVLVGGRDGTLHAVDAGSGERRWRLETGDDLPFPWGHESGDLWTSSPTLLDDGTVLFGSGDGRLYAVDAATGDAKWALATDGRIRSSPAVADGLVFVGSADGSVYAADLATGELRWRHDTQGRDLDSGEFGFDRRTVHSSPSVADGTVYVGARDGFLYAVDAATGERRWRFDHEVSWVNTSPAVVDGVVYAGSSDGHFVQAVDAGTGRELWRTETPASVWSSPAVAGDLLYVGDGSGTLRVLDRATGRERWSWRAGDRILSSPVPFDGHVYVGSDDGGVYAIREAPGGEPLRRAVFWDEAYESLDFLMDGDELRDYLDSRDYEPLDADGLAAFLEARLRDGAPSVVVFAMDRLPEAVAPVADDTVLLRRYLDAGGKVVWSGFPPFVLRRDPETGAASITEVDRAATERLLGVDHGASNFDAVGARATTAGRRWGLSGWWKAGWSVEPSAVTTVLARDELGLASSWVRSYGGPPGTGFVRLRGRRLGRGGTPPPFLSVQVAAELRPRRP